MSTEKIQAKNQSLVPAVVNGAATSVLKIIERGAIELRKVDIDILKHNQGSTISTLLDEIKDIDPTKVTAIAKVFEHGEAFAKVIREESSSTIIANNADKIADAVVSIKKDALRLKSQEEKGSLSIIDKAKNTWMVARRGTISNRFESMEKSFRNNIADAEKALRKEEVIITTYLGCREAIQKSIMLATDMHEKQGVELEKARDKHRAVSEALEDKSLDEQQRNLLQIERNALQTEFKKEERKYNICKNIKENLVVNYNASEAVIASLYQGHEVKQALNDKAKIFFATNRQLSAAIEASVIGSIGTQENARCLQVAGDSMNMMIETIAESNGKVNEQALKLAHGPLVKADSVQKLIDSINSFEESKERIKSQAQLESTANADLIQKITEDGKKRYAELVEKNINRAAGGFERNATIVVDGILEDKKKERDAINDILKESKEKEKVRVATDIN